MNLGMETETVEYKKSTGELREGMESVASILNKHGHGELFFGVGNDGEVVGQEVSEKTLRDVSRAMGNRIEPRVYPQIERLETPDGKAYIRVSFSGFETPYACDGRYRIRAADEDLPMSRAMLRQMMEEADDRLHPWDARSSGKGVGAVDEETLRAYVERGVEANRIPFGYTNPGEVLSRLGLLCDDGTLTNAAAICFTDRPETGLRMGVLADEARTDIRDNQQVSGSLFALIDAAETYILGNTRRRFVIDGTSLRRREIPEIPMEAVREALLNAFCHRRYQDLGAVQMDVFWDSLDIYSPGDFPEGASPEEYLSGEKATSRPRNPLIARALYRAGDIEAYGTGLQRIWRTCGEQGVPVDIFERGGSVHVRFTRREGVAAGTGNAKAGSLQDREVRVLAYVHEHGRITTPEAHALLDEKDYTARRLLNSMAGRGLLVKAGAGNKRVYTAPADTPDFAS